MPDIRTLTDEYRRAGTDFLAVKLMAMFSHIKTDEDKARHNIILHDVLAMLGDEKERLRFYQLLAGTILESSEIKKRRVVLSRMVAKVLIGVGKK